MDLSFVTDSSGEFFDQNILGRLEMKYHLEGKVENGIQSLNHTKPKPNADTVFNYILGEEKFCFIHVSPMAPLRTVTLFY